MYLEKIKGYLKRGRCFSLLFKRQLLIACLLLITIVCVCGYSASYLDSGSLEISEVRADYGNVLYDADGLCHGFVEVFNPTDKEICLDGWFISDNALNRQKYRIPECTIQPHSFEVFWSNAEIDVIGLPTNGCFLGFALESNESVVLSDPSGKVVGKVKIPSLNRGMSFAKGDSGIWGVRKASPGEKNTALSYELRSVSEPVFSEPSGFYEGALDVEIHAQSGVQIYYTIDGSTPDASSMKYEGPLHLTDATSQANRYSMQTDITTIESAIYTPAYNIPKIHTIRAVAIDSRGYSSDVVSASYFLDYENRYGFQDVYMLSIITDPQNLFSNEYGIYVLGDLFKNNEDKINKEKASWIYTAKTNYGTSGKGWRRSVELQLFDSNKRLIVSQPGAISIHGNYSAAFSQKSFNVYGKDNETIVFPGVFDSDSTSAMLRTGGVQDSLSTKIRDVLNQRLVADRAVTIQDGLPCQVFINGEYWGLYNLQERINEGLITSSFSVNENNLVILKNDIVVSGEEEDMALYTQVLDYAQEHDLSEAKHYEQICQWIDVQSYIDYMAFQIYIANCDSIYNNVARWRTRNIVDDQYGDGRWRWILYDTDASVGMIPERTNADVDSFSAGNWGTPPMEDLLFKSLIKNEEFKELFVRSFVDMAEHNFDSERVLKEIENMEQVYLPATVVSHNRWYHERFSEKYYLAHSQLIKDFYSERYEYIYDHMVTNLGLERNEDE